MVILEPDQKDVAFFFASKILRAGPVRNETAAIEKSYNLLKRLYIQISFHGRTAKNYVRREKLCARLHPSKIQILHAQRVLLDELAARLDHVAHQLGEEIVRLGHILHADLQQRARVRIEGGFPQLVGVHLAQTFVALQRQAFLALGKDRVEQVHGAIDHLAAVLADQLGGLVVDLLQMLREAAGFLRLA